MPARRILPDSATLAQLTDRYGYRGVAERYGVSEIAVYQQLAAANLTKKLPRYQAIPWRLAPRHTNLAIPKYLRALARAEAGGVVKPDGLLERARRWASALDVAGLTVCYDRDAGFSVDKRRPGEGRVRPHDSGPVGQPADPPACQRASTQGDTSAPRVDRVREDG